MVHASCRRSSFSSFVSRLPFCQNSRMSRSYRNSWADIYLTWWYINIIRLTSVSHVTWTNQLLKVKEWNIPPDYSVIYNKVPGTYQWDSYEFLYTGRSIMSPSMAHICSLLQSAQPHFRLLLFYFILFYFILLRVLDHSPKPDYRLYEQAWMIGPGCPNFADNKQCLTACGHYYFGVRCSKTILYVVTMVPFTDPRLPVSLAAITLTGLCLHVLYLFGVKSKNQIICGGNLFITTTQ